MAYVDKNENDSKLLLFCVPVLLKVVYVLHFLFLQNLEIWKWTGNFIEQGTVQKPVQLRIDQKGWKISESLIPLLLNYDLLGSKNAKFAGRLFIKRYLVPT